MIRDHLTPHAQVDGSVALALTSNDIKDMGIGSLVTRKKVRAQSAAVRDRCSLND